MIKTVYSSEVYQFMRLRQWSKLKRAIFFYKLKTKITLNPSNSIYTLPTSILHFACQFRPPQNVIEYILKAHPESVKIRDSDGRYAIHIACKYGCDPEVIKMIIEKNPEAASKFDSKRRTPLHLVYMDYVFTCQMEWTVANNMLTEVAGMLADIAPQIITEEDYKGMTALEYALIEEFDFSSILLLQQAVEKYQKKIRNRDMRFMI